VHRLDRQTSGVFILARDKHSARRFNRALQDRRSQKRYLARVRGPFPLTATGFTGVHERAGITEHPAPPSGGPGEGAWMLISKPLRYEGGSQRAVVAWGTLSEATAKQAAQAPGYHLDWEGCSALPPRACPMELQGPSQETADPDPTQALTLCRRVRYMEEDDTSLVECILFTGRTHQVRAHLAAVGFPIANDLKYLGLHPDLIGTASAVAPHHSEEGNTAACFAPHDDPTGALGTMVDRMSSEHGLWCAQCRWMHRAYHAPQAAEGLRMPPGSSSMTGSVPVVHRSIWLHAAHYRVYLAGQGDHGAGEVVQFSAELPEWARI